MRAFTERRCDDIYVISQLHDLCVTRISRVQVTQANLGKWSGLVREQQTGINKGRRIDSNHAYDSKEDKNEQLLIITIKMLVNDSLLFKFIYI